jgi:hypothetical protein
MLKIVLFVSESLVFPFASKTIQIKFECRIILCFFSYQIVTCCLTLREKLLETRVLRKIFVQILWKWRIFYKRPQTLYVKLCSLTVYKTAQKSERDMPGIP